MYNFGIPAIDTATANTCRAAARARTHARAHTTVVHAHAHACARARALTCTNARARHAQVKMDGFLLTRGGQVLEQQHEMNAERIQSVGDFPFI